MREQIGLLFLLTIGCQAYSSRDFKSYIDDVAKSVKATTGDIDNLAHDKTEQNMNEVKELTGSAKERSRKIRNVVDGIKQGATQLKVFANEAKDVINTKDLRDELADTEASKVLRDLAERIKNSTTGKYFSYLVDKARDTDTGKYLNDIKDEFEDSGAAKYIRDITEEAKNLTKDIIIHTLDHISDTAEQVEDYAETVDSFAEATRNTIDNAQNLVGEADNVEKDVKKYIDDLLANVNENYFDELSDVVKNKLNAISDIAKYGAEQVNENQEENNEPVSNSLDKYFKNLHGFFNNQDETQGNQDILKIKDSFEDIFENLNVNKIKEVGEHFQSFEVGLKDMVKHFNSFSDGLKVSLKHFNGFAGGLRNTVEHFNQFVQGVDRITKPQFRGNSEDQKESSDILSTGNDNQVSMNDEENSINAIDLLLRDTKKDWKKGKDKFIDLEDQEETNYIIKK